MYALEIKNLCKIYPNGLAAVKNLNLNIKQGDFFGLLGVNGAGKSTTIGLITDLLTKTSGKIFIQGYDLDIARSKAKETLGLVPQEINLNVFETCEQTLTNQAGYYGILRNKVKEHAQFLLNELGLWEKRKSITRYLSGGMKRRLMIARALIHKPKILILDEPTAGVDVEIRRSMWDFLTQTNKQGTTIILTTHYLEEAEQLCKNIAIIDKGEIIEYTSVKKLLQNHRHQTFIFNTLEPITTLPEINECKAIQIDANSFELRVDTHRPLNELFRVFTEHGIHIQSLRNKTNRLEELFMDKIHVR